MLAASSSAITNPALGFLNNRVAETETPHVTTYGERSFCERPFPVRLRILVSTVIGIASGIFCWFLLTHFHQGAADFTWAIRAAKYLLAGKNPYDTPLEQYPMTAALFGLPFLWMRPEAAAGAFYGISSALLAFGLTRYGYYRLLVLPGPLLALALWRYRDRDAILLLLAAIMPQRWFFDSFILWLIPKSRREILATVFFSYGAGIWRWYHTPHSFTEVGRWTVIFIYLPMLGVVLWRGLVKRDKPAIVPSEADSHSLPHGNLAGTSQP